MADFVTDASAALPWCFADEATPWTEALLNRLQSGEAALVPAHWPTEMMNGLIMAVRRNRIDLGREARLQAIWQRSRSILSSRSLPARGML